MNRKSPIPVQNLLKEFQEVYSKHKKLTPRRVLYHSITMKEGVLPINIRLYRYLYYKIIIIIIKKIVKQLLQSGTI